MPVWLTSLFSQTNGLEVLTAWVVARETTQCHLRKKRCRSIWGLKETLWMPLTCLHKADTADHPLWWIPMHDVTLHAAYGASTHSKTNHSVFSVSTLSFCISLSYHADRPNFSALAAVCHLALPTTIYTDLAQSPAPCISVLLATLLTDWKDVKQCKMCCVEASSDKHSLTVAAVAQQPYCTDTCKYDLIVQYTANESVTSMQCS